MEVLASFDRTIDEDLASDDNLVLLAFEEFVQDVAQIFRDVCKANFVQLQLNHQQLLDQDELLFDLQKSFIKGK